MSLSLAEVRHAAILSRLRLTTEEEILFAEQLGRIVAYIDQLREFETQTEDSDPVSGVEAPDEPAADLRGELFLDNAPGVRRPFFAVPRMRAGGGSAPTGALDE